MAPGSRMHFILGVGAEIFALGVDEALCPKVFRVSAHYEYAGHTYDEDNILDVRPMLRSAAIQDTIAEELKELRKLLETFFKRKSDT
jgi:hypothetical protein